MTFRDDQALCPTCGSAVVVAGQRHACEQCGGLQMPTGELTGLLHEMFPLDPETLESRLRPRAGETRTCPQCLSAMEMVALDGLALDRCGEHGFWFDAGELTRALEQQGERYVETTPNPINSGPRHSTTLRAIKRLFRRTKT